MGKRPRTPHFITGGLGDGHVGEQVNGVVNHPEGWRIVVGTNNHNTNNDQKASYIRKRHSTTNERLVRLDPPVMIDHWTEVFGNTNNDPHAAYHPPLHNNHHNHHQRGGAVSVNQVLMEGISGGGGIPRPISSSGPWQISALCLLGMIVILSAIFLHLVSDHKSSDLKKHNNRMTTTTSTTTSTTNTTAGTSGGLGGGTGAKGTSSTILSSSHHHHHNHHRAAKVKRKKTDEWSDDEEDDEPTQNVESTYRVDHHHNNHHHESTTSTSAAASSSSSMVVGGSSSTAASPLPLYYPYQPRYPPAQEHRHRKPNVGGNTTTTTTMKELLVASTSSSTGGTTAIPAVANTNKSSNSTTTTPVSTTLSSTVIHNRNYYLNQSGAAVLVGAGPTTTTYSATATNVGPPNSSSHSPAAATRIMSTKSPKQPLNNRVMPQPLSYLYNSTNITSTMTSTNIHPPTQHFYHQQQQQQPSPAPLILSNTGLEGFETTTTALSGGETHDYHDNSLLPQQQQHLRTPLLRPPYERIRQLSPVSSMASVEVPLSTTAPNPQITSTSTKCPLSSSSSSQLLVSSASDDFDIDETPRAGRCTRQNLLVANSNNNNNNNNTINRTPILVPLEHQIHHPTPPPPHRTHSSNTNHPNTLRTPTSTTATASATLMLGQRTPYYQTPRQQHVPPPPPPVMNEAIPFIPKLEDYHQLMIGSEDENKDMMMMDSSTMVESSSTSIQQRYPRPQPISVEEFRLVQMETGNIAAATVMASANDDNDGEDVTHDATTPKKDITTSHGLSSSTTTTTHDSHHHHSKVEEDISGAGDPRKSIIHKRTDLTHSTDAASSLQSSMDFDELKLQEVIGGGGFGQVWKAMWRGTPVAVKVLTGTAQSKNVSKAILEEFAAEINLLKGMRHPNICLYMGACLEPPNRAIVTELAANGSVWDALRLPLMPPYVACDGVTRHGWPLSLYQPDPRYGVPPSNPIPKEAPIPPKGTWPWGLVKKVACGAARGMAYLHSGKPAVLHRDLKSANLLLDESYTTKVCDFGLSRLKSQNQSMTGNCGTVQWMAPEVLANQKYAESADVFSFGIICWELLTRECPYEGMSAIQCALAVLHRDYRPEIPAWCPQPFAALIRTCVKRDPETRPTFPQIILALDSMP